MLTACALLGLAMAQVPQAPAFGPPPPSQLHHFPDAPLIRVRPMFVVAADDNGGHKRTRGSGRSGHNESPAEVAAMVRSINSAYACAGIRFEFDPKTDYVVRNQTALNRNFRSELDGTVLDEAILTDRSKLPSKWDPEFAEAKRKLVDEFPDRVVILLTDGSVWNFDTTWGRWTAATQSMGLNANGMITAFGFNAPLLIHELGHYFGLPHTFANVRAESPKAVRERLEAEIRNGKSLDEATRVFDGDGLADTPADPGTFLMEALGHKAFSSAPSRDIEITDANGVTLAWRPKPDVYNWMSYYREANYAHPKTGKVEGRFSREQCARMREFATSNLKAKLLAPPR